MTAHLDEKALIERLETAYALVQVGGRYVHYRNDTYTYKVIGLGILEATQEPAVLYQMEYGSEALRSTTWIRPLRSWLELIPVEDEKIPRFRRVE